MSDRTVPRFTLAALLAATLASPVVAQVPNPWRVTIAVAPMPRAVPDDDVECRDGDNVTACERVMVPDEERAGRPRSHCDNDTACERVIAPFVVQIPNGTWRASPLVFEGNLTSEFYPGRQARIVSPAPPKGCVVAVVPRPISGLSTLHNDGNAGWWVEEARVPQPKMARPVIVQQWSLALEHSVSDTRAQLTDPPTRHEGNNTLRGTWVRDLDGIVFAATFTADEMKVCMTQCADGHTVCVTVTTEYAVSKQGMVHGVVTGVDVDAKSSLSAAPTPLFGMEMMDLAGTLHALVDCPFSFRIKQTSAGVMVSAFKIAADGAMGKDLAIVCGMYKPAPDGKVTTRTPMKTFQGAMTLPRGSCPPPAACPAPPPAACTLPAPVPQAWSPPQPTNVPAGEFGIMADAIGQMLATKLPPPSLPPQAVLPPAAIQPLAFVTPPTLAAPAALPVAAKPGIVGTWVREVGPFVYVVKIAPDHVTLTARAAAEVEDGKVVVEGMTITADYHLARDGSTIVGLIAGVDALLEGTLPGDAQPDHLMDELNAAQKHLTDKPFAMGLRVYGDSLVIGNVRLPAPEGPQGARIPTFGGRYTALGDKMLPKPKTMKVTARPQPVLNHPSPYSLHPHESSDRIPPPAPRVTEQPPVQVPMIPIPSRPPSGSHGGTKGLLTVDEFDSVPPMPPPIPPAAETPKKKKGKKKAEPERVHGRIL